jgi:aminoglycoside phosphotransferase (APT) family kinase protein
VPDDTRDGTSGSTTPWRRDQDEIEAALRRWARDRWGDGAAVTDVRVPASGMANDTVLFRLGDDALVARFAPHPEAPYPTFPRYDLRLQQRAIELVRDRTAVPVPEVVHLEEREEYVGVPFLVVRAVQGDVPGDNPPYLLDPGGWFLQGSPEDRARLEASTIEVLVALHRVTDDGEGTAFLRHDQPGDTALARQLAHQRDYHEWARDGRRVPVLEEAFDRLAATVPDNPAAVLNWGDSRPGNIIYRDFEPVAVLDWEMAGIGPPEVDVAWATFFQRFFASMAEQWGLPPVPPMFEAADTAASYERLGGRPLDRLAWYEAFAGLRFGAILTRMSLRSIAFGIQEEPDDPDDLVMFAPLLRRLLEEI